MNDDLITQIIRAQNSGYLNYEAVRTDEGFMVRQKTGINKLATLLGLALTIASGYYLYLFYAQGVYTLPFGLRYCWGAFAFGVVIVLFRQTQGQNATLVDVAGRQIVSLKRGKKVKAESFDQIQRVLIDSVEFQSGAGVNSAVFLIMPSGKKLVGCFKDEADSEQYVALLNQLLHPDSLIAAP